MTELLTKNLALVADCPDGVKQLRALILELAMMGKLVRQDGTEQSSTDVLKQIEAEIRVLLKSGRIKKRAVSRAVTGPFTLPTGWRWQTISDICSVVTDGDHQAPPQTTEGVPFVVISDIRSGTICPGIAKRYVPQDYFESLDWSKKAQKSDVLLTVVGSYGIPVLVKESLTFCFQRHIALLRPALPALQEWLYIALKSPLLQQQMATIATGTAQKTVPLTGLRDCVLPIPPLSEQQRIVAKVTELMELCNHLELQQQLAEEAHKKLVTVMLGLLLQSSGQADFGMLWETIEKNFDILFTTESSIETLKQTLLRLAMSGRLIPQDPKDQPASKLLSDIRAKKVGNKKYQERSGPESRHEISVPSGWEMCRFFEIADIKSELVSPRDYEQYQQVAPDSIEKNTGILLQRRTVRESGVISPNHHFYPGQILYSKIRPSLSKAVLVDFEGLCSADMYPIQAHIDPKFLLLQMLSPTFLEQVKVVENRVKMPKLNQESLNSFWVVVPPLAEQKRIVEAFEELSSICDELKNTFSLARFKREQISIALIQQVPKRIDIGENEEVSEPVLV